MNMNKVMMTMAKAGALYIGAFAIWKLGIWHGMCTDVEGGVFGYLKYVEKNEKNLFGKMFTMGAIKMAEQFVKAGNN